MNNIEHQSNRTTSLTHTLIYMGKPQSLCWWNKTYSWSLSTVRYRITFVTALVKSRQDQSHLVLCREEQYRYPVVAQMASIDSQSNFEIFQHVLRKSKTRSSAGKAVRSPRSTGKSIGPVIISGDLVLADENLIRRTIV